MRPSLPSVTLFALPVSYVHAPPPLPQSAPAVATGLMLADEPPAMAPMGHTGEPIVDVIAMDPGEADTDEDDEGDDGVEPLMVLLVIEVQHF